MNPTDPLAELKPLMLPEPTGFWPPGPGWWLLALLLLAVVVAAGIYGVLFYRKHKIKRRYLAKIRDLKNQWQMDRQNFSPLKINHQLNLWLREFHMELPAPHWVSGDYRSWQKHLGNFSDWISTPAGYHFLGGPYQNPVNHAVTQGDVAIWFEEVPKLLANLSNAKEQLMAEGQA